MMRVAVFSVMMTVFSVTALAQTQQPPYPNGMRVQVGQAVLVRNTPSLSGTCGSDNHACTAADSVVPGVYGVIQPDAPVLDPAGWWWERITYDTGQTGWSSSYPPYINALNPLQMISGVSFSVVGDYSGPTLTQAECNTDGLATAATLQLQPSSGGQQGTLLCPIKTPGVGNHKTAIIARNNAGSSAPAELSWAVTSAPIPTPPNVPTNLRIAPLGGTTATQGLETAKPPTTTTKPTKE